ACARFLGWRMWLSLTLPAALSATLASPRPITFAVVATVRPIATAAPLTISIPCPTTNLPSKSNTEPRKRTSLPSILAQLPFQECHLVLRLELRVPHGSDLRQFGFPRHAHGETLA